MQFSRFDYLLIQVVFFTISCDIFFLVYKFPTIRLYQCLIIYLIFKFLILNFKIKLKISKPIIYLIVFWVINLLFSTNSGFLPKGFGYSLWLLLDILLVIFLGEIINKNNIEQFMKLFINSIFFVSLFGIIQFIGSIFGYGEHLGVLMWWVDGEIPRINAFSYEPSFLISYLITGYVFISYLLLKNVYLMNKTAQRIGYLLIAFTILISGSRMGILLLILWELFLGILLILKIIKYKAIKHDDLLLSLTKIAILMVIVIIFSFFSNSLKLTLLNGTGFMGTSEHSILERFEGFQNIIKLFINSPLIGYSLGGLSYHLSIDKYGVAPLSFIESKLEGNGVILEILAATGLFGFITFLLFIKSLFNRYYLIIISKVDIKSEKLKYIFIAFSIGLLFQFISIQPNQNILRTYLWLNIGIYLAMCKILINDYKNER